MQARRAGLAGTIGGDHGGLRGAAHAALAAWVGDGVELIVSDGAEAIVSAGQTVYAAARHQLCLAHWFCNLEALTPRFPWGQRRKFRRGFW